MGSVSREQVLRELHDGFAALKKELGFKAGFEELDRVFFLEDAALHAGFVSRTALSRQICARIADAYMSWNNYLHGLIIPNPHYMIQVNESKMLSDEDKKTMGKMISEGMRFVSGNMLNGLMKDKKAEAAFIDGALALWDESYCSQLAIFLSKIYSGWKK